MSDSDLKEKKFGYVVHPPHPPCPPPFPGPIPPGIHTQDWLAYINSYIDVRARQLYEKLKGMVTAAGVQEVTYEESSDIGSNKKQIGTLKVDNRQTAINVPGIRLSTPDKSNFANPKKILTFEGINNGNDVDVYCEGQGSSESTNEFDGVILRDVNNRNDKYRLYIQGGVLMSEPYNGN